MALSEIGRHDEARPMIERSLAQYRRNAYGAHAFAHLCICSISRCCAAMICLARFFFMPSRTASVVPGARRPETGHNRGPSPSIRSTEVVNFGTRRLKNVARFGGC